MENVIDTDGRMVGADTQAPAVASLARAKLESVVAAGMRRAGPVIDRVLSEVPTDAIVRGSALRFNVAGSGDVSVTRGQGRLGLHRNALGQIADRAGIPLLYLESLAVEDAIDRSEPVPRIVADNTWRRNLAQHALNEHFSHDSGRYLVRSVNGQARGFLSDRFRRLDSRPLLEAFVTGCKGIGAVPYEGLASDVRAYVRAIVPHVYEPVPGEAMVLGLEWSNSDYGKGTYSISAFVLRLICLNGMTGASRTRNVHLGGRLDERIEFSEATYRKDTETMVSATRDVVRGALGPKAIETQMDAVRRAHSQETNWASAFRRVSKALTKAEAESVRSAFEGPDVINLPAGRTQWRFSNALSWVANATEDAERKAELQGLAGQFAA